MDFDQIVPIIGLFVGSMDFSYANSLMRGAMAGVEDGGGRLVCFNGGNLNSYHGYEAMRNILYGLVDSRNIDGLVLSGSISHHISQGEFQEFCHNFQPIPLVTIGVQISGIPCVISDNHQGMEALMDHLLDHHGYTRLAYVGGPPGQQEAEIRKTIFQKKLQEHGIQPNPEWMVFGDYSRESGNMAVNLLLNGPVVPFQGIVAANDSMALGINEALAMRGYQIPKDLFLTGFDDSLESQFHPLLLTTVHQSIYRQASTASRLAIQLARGQTVAMTTDLSAELVVRSSCNCPPSAVQVPNLDPEPKQFIEEGLFKQLRQAILQALDQKDMAAFSQSIMALLEKFPIVDVSQVLQERLNIIQQELGEGALSAQQRCHLALLCEIARKQILQTSLKSLAYARFQAEILAANLNVCSETLATAFDLATILENLEYSIPRLGMHGAWLWIFGHTEQLPLDAKLVLTSDRYNGNTTLPHGSLFPAWELVPGGLARLDQRHKFLIVEALYSQKRGLGFVVFSTDLTGISSADNLRSQISGALQGAHLLAKRQEAEQQMIQSEKMAALGNLVAGVAHEINTPLGVAISAASFLQGISSDFQNMSATQAIKKSELDQYVAESQEAGSLIVSNLQRAAHLVSSFKLVASDQTNEDRRIFELKGYIAETLISLEPQWRNRPVKIGLSGPDNLIVDTFPGAIAQIVSNLLINSLNHAFDRLVNGEGRITMNLEDRGDTIFFQFSDNGSGIAREHLARIFEPFFTTKRGHGGTGLGLHIVYNLIDQVLGGSIVCTSQPGKGAIFDMLFPRMAPQRSKKEVAP